MIDGFENMSVDITVNNPVQIDSQYIGIGIDGTMFDMSKGETRLDVPVPLMPAHTDNAPGKF